MVDRYLLRYFLAVIDHGNFSKAAAHCNVSQPTLSVGIGKLERELGRPLFSRTNRRVALTDAGATLAARARRIEAEFSSIELAVRERAQKPVLRLGVLTTIPTHLVERLSAAFRDEPGDQSLEIVEGRASELVERLGRGRLDVALTIIHGDRERFASESLFSEGYSLALPEGHPFAKRPHIAAEDLTRDAMIIRRHCELLAETSRHFTARGVRPFFSAKTTNDDRALGYVRAGLGITLMPDGYRIPGVARVPLAAFSYTREIGFLFAPHFGDGAISGFWPRPRIAAAVEQYLAAP